MKPRHPVMILVLVLASVLALAACGGDDDDGGEDAAQEAAPAETTTGGGGQAVSEVSMSEFEFEPSDVTAEAGSTITVENAGTTEHDLKLRKSGKEVGGTEVFGAGKSQQLKVDFAPGEYEMFCSVPGHEDSGMKGTFTVE